MESPRTRSWTLLALASLMAAAAGGKVRYDQTQTGDTNIHLEVKNVEVVALLDDSTLEQYEYDYHDLTEKPPKPGANSTWATHDQDPVVEAAANATERPLLGPTAAPAAAPDAAPAAAPDAAAPEAPTPTPAKRARRCGAGYHRDANGHCRRTRRPNLQMLMHLGRKPSQTVTDPSTPTAA